jgi:hypothetical protein
MLLGNASWADVLKVINTEKKRAGGLELVTQTLVNYRHQLEQGAGDVCRKFVQAARYITTTYPQRIHSLQFNYLAWTIFQYDTSQADLKLALHWSQSAVDSAASMVQWKADFLDTYSNLLYKLGRKSEAIDWERRAISMRPEDAVKRETLIKMQRGAPTW